MINANDILTSKSYQETVSDLLVDLQEDHQRIDLSLENADHLLRDNAYKQWALRELHAALEVKARNE